MAISKVTLNGDTLMDVTQDTVAANNLLSGETATGADGEGVTGNIATKTSSNMTVSGATVTAPAGYYATAASKSVASGSASTPATTITANPTISVSSAGLITATTSTTKSVTPTVTAGYVSSGTAGTITVSGSNTQQLTTQAAKTVTPTTSSQTAVEAGKYTTGAVTVGAIPSEYIIPSGTKTITENGTGIDVASYANVDVNVAQNDSYIKIYFVVQDNETITIKITSGSIGTINWGDGSAEEDIGTTKQHTYKYGGYYLVTILGDRAFLRGNAVDQTSSNHNTSLIAIDLCGGTMDSSSFTYCDGLESVILQKNSVSNINTAQTFSYCTALQHLYIGEDVTMINNLAFYGCTSLETVIIPSGVTAIGNNAFAGCTSLATVHVLPTTPPTLGSAYVFNNNAAGRIIYVPYSSDHSILAAYQSATNWSNFASAMQEEPQ